MSIIIVVVVVVLLVVAQRVSLFLLAAKWFSISKRVSYFEHTMILMSQHIRQRAPVLRESRFKFAMIGVNTGNESSKSRWLLLLAIHISLTRFLVSLSLSLSRTASLFLEYELANAEKQSSGLLRSFF